jgi:hypothetical protein
MTAKEIQEKWAELLLGTGTAEQAFIAGYCTQALLDAGKIRKSTYNQILNDLDETS